MDELSKITGVPFGLTANAPDVAKKAADQIEIDDALSQGAPSTTAFLADPKNATIARGGMKELTEIEKFLNKYEGFSTFGKGFEIGQMQTELAEMAKPLLDAEEGKMDMGLLARVQAKAAELGALQQQSTDEGWLGTTIGTGFGQQVGQIGATLESAGAFGLAYLGAAGIAGIATKGKGTSIAGSLAGVLESSKSLSDLRNSMRLGGAFGSVKKGYELESVLAFTEYLADGIPEAEARGAALAVGALNTVVESATDVMLISGTDFGRRLLFGSAVDKKTLIKTLLKTEGFKKAAIEFGKRGIVGSIVNGIEEGIQEIVGISGQQVAQAVSGTDVQGKEYKEFSIPEAAAQVGQAVVAGGVSGGVLVTAGNAPSLLADMRSAKTANFRESFFKAADKLNASKVAARSKDAAINFFNRVSKDKGVQKIEIAREQFDGFFQSAGVDAKDIPEIASSLGIKNYAESQATGVELEIDAGDFATKIASNSEMFDAMKGHVRINGAMTATEELSIRQQNEKVLTDILNGLRKDGTLDESSPEFTDLKNKFTEEFIKQGQSRAVAEKSAEIHATHLYVLAANDNKTLKEAVPMFPLEVKNPDMKQEERPPVDVSVDPYLDALRTGQYPESKPTGDTIIQAIRRLSGGGVAPMAEMSDMDSKRVPVQSGGRGLDQILGELVGEGYISEGDGINEVLDLIKEEIAGNPTYSMAASGELSQADIFKQNADTIAKYISGLGIDVKTVTDNAEVRRLIAEREKAAGMVNIDGKMVNPETGLDASGEFALFQSVSDEVQKKMVDAFNKEIEDNLSAVAIDQPDADEASQFIDYIGSESNTEERTTTNEISIPLDRSLWSDEVKKIIGSAEKDTGISLEDAVSDPDSLEPMYGSLSVDDQVGFASEEKKSIPSFFNGKSQYKGIFAVTYDLVPTYFDEESKTIDISISHRLDLFRQKEEVKLDIRDEKIETDLSFSRDSFKVSTVNDLINSDSHMAQSKAFKVLLDSFGINYSEDGSKSIGYASQYFYIDGVDNDGIEKSYKIRFSDHSNQSAYHDSADFNVATEKDRVADSLKDVLYFLARNSDKVLVDESDVSDPKFLSSKISGSFSASDPRILYQSTYSPLGFNSKLVQTIEQKMGGAATADQIRGLLKDVKQEEKDWLGIEDLLKTKDKFTKKEVLDHLAANDLQIEEVTKGNAPPPEYAFLITEDDGTERMFGNFANAQEYADDNGGYRVETINFDPLTMSESEFLDYDSNEVESPTKFENYTFGGGKNYREVLFTLPTPKSSPEGLAKRQAVVEKYTPQLDDLNKKYSDPRTPSDEADKISLELRALWNKIYAEADSVYPLVENQPENLYENQYNSPHFKEKNILAHTRLNDRVDADGKKILFVEEIQSDWHQAGRKGGYKKEQEAKRKEFVDFLISKGEDTEAFDISYARLQAAGAPADMLSRFEDFLKLGNGFPVRDAPFKKTWHEFVMKRVIRMAAEQGYDRIAWTTGEQQAERYDLSKQIGEVHYSGSNLKAYDLKGKTVIDQTGVSESALESYIGKEAAKKLLEQPKQGTLRSLVGQDLKVGGEGMKGFYDKILVNFANSFGKKFGAKVGSITLETPAQATKEDVQLLNDLGVEGTAENRATVHSLDITPALKESAIKDGFPLFQGRESARGAITINQDMSATLLLFKNHDESTVPHELGHRYLEMLSYLARQDGATQITKDQDKRVKDWLKDFGMKGKHIDALKSELEMVKKNQTGDYRFKVASKSLEEAEKLVTKRREELDNAKATGSKRLIQQALEKLDKAKLKAEARKAAVESASFDYGDRAKKIEQAISMFEAGGEDFLTTFLSDLGWAVEDKELRSIMITPFHELFAETHERYLMEGKAPASWLRDLFNTFNAWLTNLYRRKVKPGVEITPELEEIFKRMYVAESELEVAAKEIPSDPIFMTAEEAGLSPEEFEVYVKETKDALAQAKARMVSTMIQEANRENKRWWKARRDELEEEIRKQVEAQPEYVISDSIKAGVTDQDVRIKKINEQSIIEAVGPAFYETIKTRMKPYVAQKGGMALDRVAFAFDIVNPDQLVSILSNLQDKESVINNAVDVKMVERYGDIQADGMTYDKAIEALNNEEREKMIDRERQIIHAKARSVKPFINAKDRAENRRAQEAAAMIPTKEQMKQTVEKKISTMALRELSPGKYLRASLKASADAVQFVRQKDFTAAAEAKTRQLLNHYMYVQSKEALSFGEKLTRYARKFEEKNIRKRFVKHSPQALAQIDEVLDKYSFKTITFKKIDRLKQLFEFLRDAGEASGRDFISDIPPELISLSEKRNYRDIPLDDLRVIKTVLERLDHQNRLKTKLKDGREAEEFKEKVGVMVSTIRENARTMISVNDQMKSNDKVKKLLRLLGKFNLNNKKLPTLVYTVEGFKGSGDKDLGTIGGPVWEYLMKTYLSVASKKASMVTDASKTISSILGPFFKRHKNFSKAKIRFSTIPGRTFSVENILSVALNSGNDGNMQRLLDGEGWSASQHKEIINYLDADDWKTVQAIWDFMEQYRPMLDAHEKRLLGNEMEFVKPTPFMTKYGEVKGGYFPITYDSGRSAIAAQFEDISAAQAMMEGAKGASKPTDGFKKNRVDAVKGRPLALTIDGVFTGTTNVIHYLTHFEYVLDANRLLNNRRFAEAIKDHYGLDLLQQIKTAVKDIATDGDQESRLALNKMMAHLRAGIGISALGLNFYNAFQNMSGITNSFAIVGYGYVIRNVGKFSKNPIAATKMVHEKSEMMRNRYNTMNRTMGEIMNNMDKTSVVKEKVKFISMLPNIMTQGAVDIPTWMAAYEKFEDNNGIMNDEQEALAIAYADAAVTDSQGSSFIGLLSGIERKESLKIFTLFYSYFNTVLNVSMQVTGRTNFKDPMQVVMAVRDYFTIFVIPAAFTVGLKALLSNKDEDEEEIAKMFANEQISFMLGTVPLLREFTGGVQYAAGTKDYGQYSGPAALRFVAEFEKFAKGVTKDEISASVVKAGVTVGGIVLHLPTGQAVKTVEGAMAIMDGDAGPAALIVGKPPKK
jgi:hypothetical protein